MSAPAGPIVDPIVDKIVDDLFPDSPHSTPAARASGPSPAAPQTSVPGGKRKFSVSSQLLPWDEAVVRLDFALQLSQALSYLHVCACGSRRPPR
eukprot:5074957-Prymnesium_polylepis.1